MIKRELSKDPALAQEDWSRFLPKFRKSSNPSLKKPKITKKDRQLYPPPQLPSKIDLMLESGEYFLSAEQRKVKELEQRKSEQEIKSSEKRVEREKAFVAPKETEANKTHFEPTLSHSAADASADELAALKQKFLDKVRQSLTFLTSIF